MPSFFDEIGDMSLSLQAKLLRVLQDFEFSRLGGHKTITVDARIIAASNKNLPEMIRKGDFRSDLFHRLNGVCLSLPPLRQRNEDILELAEFFLMQCNTKYNKNIKDISSPVKETFYSYHWPGNVRELKNCLERAVVICEGNCIYPEHLPDSIANTPIN
ncbi:MAG: sigma 54-interacting transcriptional regulator, partial [Spirochaetota bacterium]